MAPPMWRKKLKTYLKWQYLKNQLLNPECPYLIMTGLFIAEVIVNLAVIWKVKYTEIDWIAYMQEVEGFLNGTLDYGELKGDTGPLVYPAGFVYVFSGLYYLTNHGVNVKLAQYFFMGLYLTNLLLVFNVYRRAKVVPPFVFLFMCCTSYRIHSIFILRLFNDPVAVFLFFIALNFMLSDNWTLACLFYSLSVSIKMNILLFAPALLYLLLCRHGIYKTFLKYIALCALVQLVLAYPFLQENPKAYLVMSFDFSRKFFFKWTVNWRFLNEELFLNTNFHLCLLALHLFFLMTFGYFRWIKKNGGLRNILLGKPKNELGVNDIIEPLFVSNFIGMCFSRSLHYQFYVWYFYTLHYLLWRIPTSSTLRLLLLGLIEMSWNTYPSTSLSSLTLHGCHFVLLIGLWFRKSEEEKTVKIS